MDLTEARKEMTNVRIFRKINLFPVGKNMISENEQFCGR
jgi:hypothetical protein